MGSERRTRGTTNNPRRVGAKSVFGGFRSNEKGCLVDDTKIATTTEGQNNNSEQNNGLSMPNRMNFSLQRNQNNGGPEVIKQSAKNIPVAEMQKNKLPSILHVLQHNAQIHPNKVLVNWINHKGKVSGSLQCGHLWSRSNAIKDYLLKNGVQKGDRVMIAYPFGLKFLEGLLGCMLAGAIACSVYPPNPTGKDKEKTRHSFGQFNTQVKNAGAKYALTTAKFKLAMITAGVMGYKTKVTWISTDAIVSPLIPTRKAQIKIKGSDIALIQFSSGSTGSPKGVVLTHKAMLHNIRAIHEVSIGDDTDAVGVNWIPQYHDYGLFTAYLIAVYTSNGVAYNMSPLDFIKNPLLWADVMDKFKATHTAGPNFSYGLLAKRMHEAGRKLKHGKGFRRVNIAAEPIAPETIEAMKYIGFPGAAINPTYGLAETGAYMTSCLGAEISFRDGFISCGSLRRSEALGKFCVVADGDGRLVADGDIGEICIRGPDLASGYWRKKKMSSSKFTKKLADGKEYFPTGDLGMIADGMLYVAGRSKELIIVNGTNVYPTDLERTLEYEFPDIVRPGSTVAFQYDESSVGVVLELRHEILPAAIESKDHKLNEDSVRQLILSAHGVQVEKMVFLKKGSVPKTTSGKVRRMETRRLSLENAWDIEEHLVWESEDFLANSAEEEEEIPMNLPSKKLPSIYVKEIMAVEADPDLLDLLFKDLRLDKVPELIELWVELDKSTEALQAMCRDVISLIEAQQPTFVQFAHLVSRNEDLEWFNQGSEGALKDTIHCMFVLDWATRTMATPGHGEILSAKLADEAEAEKKSTQFLKKVYVPQEARFLVDGMSHDPLFGVLDNFTWLKNRSVKSSIKIVKLGLTGADVTTFQSTIDGVDWLTWNVLEAVWTDYRAGRLDNVAAGSWVAARTMSQLAEIRDDGLLEVGFEHPLLPPAYRAWNMAFITHLSDSPWMIAKLLIPTLMRNPGLFIAHRLVSLSMVTSLFTRRKMMGITRPSIFSKRSMLALGCLSKRWIYRLDVDLKRDWVTPAKSKCPSVEMRRCFTKFNRIAAAKKEDVEDPYYIVERREFPDEPDIDKQASAEDSEGAFDSIMKRMLGPDVDYQRSWDENGLASLMHVELMNFVSMTYGITLPPNFHEKLKTPAALQAFVDKKVAKMEKQMEKLDQSHRSRSRHSRHSRHSRSS